MSEAEIIKICEKTANYCFEKYDKDKKGELMLSDCPETMEILTDFIEKKIKSKIKTAQKLHPTFEAPSPNKEIIKTMLLRHADFNKKVSKPELVEFLTTTYNDTIQQ